MTKKNRSNRAEFSPKTKELTAKRAGYRCSFPGCDRTTVGPNKHPDKHSNIGVASHIYGAAISGGGPRGTGGLSDEELKSPQNAIWLCREHGDLIDKHGGEDFPSEKLFSYKALHEARIERELTGIHSPFGWIDKMKIHSSPLFSDNIEFDFSQVTLITGGNSVGKTALCEWLAAITHARYLERWAPEPSSREKLSIAVDYHNPEPHTASVSFLSDKLPEFKLDNTHTTIPIAPLKVIFPQNLPSRFGGDGEQNHLDLISSALNLHPYEVLALCEDIKPKGSNYIKRVFFEEHDDGCTMVAELEEGNKASKPRILQLISSSEREKLMMELGIIAANRVSALNPTVLIHDINSSYIDADWLKRYKKMLIYPACKFQTVISIPSGKFRFDDLEGIGWKVVELREKPPHVIIRNGIRE